MAVNFPILIRFSWLKITSSFLVNIAAGLFLLMFTIKDPRVLILDALFVIVFLAVSIRLEELIEDYDWFNWLRDQSKFRSRIGFSCFTIDLHFLGQVSFQEISIQKITSGVK